MLLSVLGKLTLTDDTGSEIVIRRHMHRKLLTTLAVHAGKAFTALELTDALCGDEPPDNCGHAIRTHIWAVRKILPPGLLIRGHDGYRLQLNAGDLDIEKFRGLSVRGDRSRAAGLLDAAKGHYLEALKWWDDPPLADLPPSDPNNGIRQTLLAERRRATDALADLRLEIGEHAEILPELMNWLHLHPEDESAWHRVMLALYRSGRRGEALSMFIEARRALEERFGIPPGTGLLLLQQRMLHDDPALRLTGN